MCIPDQNAIDTHLLVPNILSSAAFADDLLCPTSTIQDLKIQARKLTLYSDWAALVISGSKTKATGILQKHPPRDENGLMSSQTLSHQLKQTIEVQQQKAQFIASDEPFLYLGVELTMDLNWKHQIQRMTGKLRNKQEALSASYASPRQTLNIIHTAIIPSLAYAFAVTPCTSIVPADLIIWDNMIRRTIKHKLWKSTATAMIREDISNFWPWSTLCLC